MNFDFDSNDASAIVGIQDCTTLVVGSFGIEPCGNTWTTAVFTVVYDAGGGVWSAYPSVATITTSARNSERLDLSWVKRIALKITTVEGSSQRLFGTFFGHQET